MKSTTTIIHTEKLSPLKNNIFIKRYETFISKYFLEKKVMKVNYFKIHSYDVIIQPCYKKINF